MLGLSRKEVRERFDRIVDFSGLERFIDVPVKAYSSGMYVRLAFSVAAHLNPEIVILDEVLAVGDAVFQKKCFDRMEEIINEGHAAILVSHRMAHLRRLSQFCLWLRHGRVEMFGPTHEIVSAYEKQAAHNVVSINESQAAKQPVATAPEPKARLSGWAIQGAKAIGPHTMIASHEGVLFRLEIELAADIAEGSVSISIVDFQGLTLFTQQRQMRNIRTGHLALLLELPMLPLKPGEYVINCTISDNEHPIAFLRAPRNYRYWKQAIRSVVSTTAYCICRPKLSLETQPAAPSDTPVQRLHGVF
jgi:lipopolysaccharide transport system ATP-binding protein